MKILSQPLAKGTKSLFRVMSAGNILVGSFGSKFLALKAMRNYNRKLRPGERPAWVTHGPDHWRAKENSKVPRRGAEPVWVPGEPFPTLTFIPSAVYWGLVSRV